MIRLTGFLDAVGKLEGKAENCDHNGLQQVVPQREGVALGVSKKREISVSETSINRKSLSIVFTDRETQLHLGLDSNSR